MGTEIILTPEVNPEVFNHVPGPNTSKRYRLIETDAIVKALGLDGWLPTHHHLTRSRTAERQQYSKHLIRFSNERFPRDQDGDLTEIVVGNSHDKSGAFLLALGVNVFVCSNGLISARDGFCTKLYHVNITMERILDAVTKLALQVPRVIERKSWLRSIPVSPVESIEFAQRVIDLRYDGERYKIDPAQLVRPNRPEQSNPDMWNTYNTVQENLINPPDLYGITSGNRRKVRSLKQIAKVVRVNQALDLAVDNFAEELGYKFE